MNSDRRPMRRLGNAIENEILRNCRVKKLKEEAANRAAQAQGDRDWSKASKAEVRAHLRTLGVDFPLS